MQEALRRGPVFAEVLQKEGKDGRRVKKEIAGPWSVHARLVRQPPVRIMSLFN